MAYSNDLIASARKLLGGTRGRPRQSDCNRAVSTAYYAVFDCLCRGIANRMIGPLKTSKVPDEDWVSVYRSIDYETSKGVLEALISATGSPLELKRFATSFAKLKNARHEADYNPTKIFNKSSAGALIDEAEAAIKAFSSLSKDVVAQLMLSLLVKIKRR